MHSLGLPEKIIGSAPTRGILPEQTGHTGSATNGRDRSSVMAACHIAVCDRNAKFLHRTRLTLPMVSSTSAQPDFRQLCSTLTYLPNCERIIEFTCFRDRSSTCSAAKKTSPHAHSKLACILLPHDFLVRARLFACHNFQCSIGSMRPRWQCMSNCHPYRDNECVLRFIMTDHINDPNVDSPGTYFFNSKGRVVKRTIYRHVKALEMDRGS